MADPTFKQLWNAYPKDDSPCRNAKGEPAHSNQCAIRVGVALASCGVETDALKLTHCNEHKKKQGHVLRAEELAHVLMKKKPVWIGNTENIPSQGYTSKIAGRTGIIFFKDYWMRSTDAKGKPTGDHIDLWNENRMTSLTSWFRVQFGIVIPSIWSDLEKAKAVYFWHVK